MSNRLRYAVAGLCICFAAFPLHFANACSRAVFFGQMGQTVTGRTMDWQEDMHTDLWIFPRGMKHDGGMGEKGFKWTSKYGSVIASVYEAGTADGMNEMGLVANLLFLVESEYPSPDADNRPLMSISAWTQYVLDSFESVEEAVAALRKESFRPVSVIAPNGVEGKIHLSISDPSGDSAIFEYINGKLVIHHGQQFQVMTNTAKHDLRDRSKANRRRIACKMVVCGKSVERESVDDSVSIERPLREPEWHPSQIYLCNPSVARLIAGGKVSVSEVKRKLISCIRMIQEIGVAKREK